MHQDTLALLLAAIRAEVQGDPTGRGYGGLEAAEIAARMNSPTVVVPPQARRNVAISDVKGYLAARLVIVRLRRDPPALTGMARDIAEALLDILGDTQLRDFLTAEDATRTNVLGMFATLVAAGAGGLSAEHLAEIESMTLAPAGEPVVSHPRWLDVMLALPIAARDGLPNEVSAAMVKEALA